MRFFADEFRLFSGFDVLRVEAFQIFNLLVFAFSFWLSAFSSAKRQIAVGDVPIVLPILLRLVMFACAVVETDVACDRRIWRRHFRGGNALRTKQAVDVRRGDGGEKLAAWIRVLVVRGGGDDERTRGDEREQFMLVERKVFLPPDELVETIDEPNRHMPVEMLLEMLRQVFAVFTTMESAAATA